LIKFSTKKLSGGAKVDSSTLSLPALSTLSSSLTSLASANQAAWEALVSLKVKMETVEKIEDETGEVDLGVIEASRKKERILGLFDRVELLVE
jgi:hypothetical protein